MTEDESFKEIKTEIADMIFSGLIPDASLDEAIYNYLNKRHLTHGDAYDGTITVLIMSGKASFVELALQIQDGGAWYYVTFDFDDGEQRKRDSNAAYERAMGILG